VFNHRPTISAMVDPNIDLSFLPPDMKSAIDQAVSGNPTLRETDRRAEAAGHQVGVARSDYFPRLDLVGQGNREENVDTIAGLRRDWSVLLKFTWELFSGFATTASYNAAIYEKLNQQDIYLDRRRQVVQDLEIAWEALATARERVRLLENAVSIAEEVFVARGRLRDSGRETAINVLDAQSELFGAQLNAVTASYDAQVTAFRVLAAMGALTPDNLKM
jgi:adhesin transport system outer membrane protein